MVNRFESASRRNTIHSHVFRWCIKRQ